MTTLRKALYAPLCVVILLLASCTGIRTDAERITVHLTAPLSPYILDFDTNNYKLWLEEQTGLHIEITWLPREDAVNIARQQLETGTDLPDAYIGFGDFDLFTNSALQTYGESGVIIALNSLIDTYGTYTKALWDELQEYHIKRYMTSADGNIYFMPGFSSSVITRYRQLLWINGGWLRELNLEMPSTTDEFNEVLRAFKEHYPDRIPMAGTEGSYSKQPYDFLFNAFIYNDINNFRLFIDNGTVAFAPAHEQWRAALLYMRGLYDEGLYSPLSFIQDDQQLIQMANDPMDILGVFISPGITQTVLQNSPEIMERYIGVPPLEGPDGIRLATIFTSTPKANGVITSKCEHPDEVFKLFDLMLSEDACLMGRYGEQGVDWDFADDGDVSIYGTPATIRIINQIWNTPQNKHLSQIVPYVSRPKYSGGVTWAGDATDGEYMNAQAAMLSVGFEPAQTVGKLIFTPDEDILIHTLSADIEAYVDVSIIDFITGKQDIYDDGVWAEYLNTLDSMGLSEFLLVAQQAYDRSEN